jgi:hypothetical protein
MKQQMPVSHHEDFFLPAVCVQRQRMDREAYEQL